MGMRKCTYSKPLGGALYVQVNRRPDEEREDKGACVELLNKYPQKPTGIITVVHTSISKFYYSFWKVYTPFHTLLLCIMDATILLILQGLQNVLLYCNVSDFLTLLYCLFTVLFLSCLLTASCAIITRRSGSFKFT